MNCSLASAHLHSSLCNYGLGGNFGTPAKAASSTTQAGRGYEAASAPKFGMNKAEQAFIDATRPLFAGVDATGYTGSALGSGWVPFAGAPHQTAAKPSRQLNVIA